MEDYKDWDPPERQCDGCTACCEGWLQAEALGKSFFPGQPCHWKGCNGCTVYEKRPPVCSNFQCAWKLNHFLPEWFKPTVANVIPVWRRWKAAEDCSEKESGLYLCLTPMKGDISMDALTWLLNYVAAEAINIRYSHEGRWHWVGSSSFMDWNLEGCPTPTTKPQ